MIRAQACWRYLLIGALLLGAWQSLAFAQCEMCKTGLTNSAEGARLVDGFRSGILLLMVMPYLLVGTLGLVIYSAHRRHSARPPDKPESGGPAS